MNALRCLHWCLAMGLSTAAAPGAAAGPTIKVATISSVTGPGASSDAWRAAQAYFDAINASGGIRGLRIDYRIEDDATQSPAAAAAAQRLAADREVVALVGGSSVLDCAVNHAAYEQAGLMSLPGGGVDPMCFATPNIVPVNAGPYFSMANALSFARTVLRRERLCVVSPALPGMVEAFQAMIVQWATRAGTKPPPMEVFRLEESLGPVLQRVAGHRCDALVYTGPEGPAIAWAQQASVALPGVAQIYLTSAYTSGVATALGAAGEGVYAMAEFEPWSSSSLQIIDWRRLMLSRKIAPSSLSQGGYLAAQMFVKAVRMIEGPVTRESVARALREMPPVVNALTAEPFVVGNASAHSPNRSAIPMQLSHGRWRVAHSAWISYAP
jgi:branched-chain amino acid transport system substrate-binding protein